MIRTTFIVISLALAAGCSRPAPRSPDGRVVVRYWEKWSGIEAEAIQSVVDDFNTAQDRIRVELLNVSLIDQKLMLATAGGNPPDLAGLWSQSVPDFAEKGALLPLDRALREAGIGPTHYVPVFWDLCRHRGRTWALPSTPATLALHWNRALFREAGLDPDRPPGSLAELDVLAERLTLVRIVRDGAPVDVRFSDLTPAERAAHRFDLLQVGHLPQEPGWWLSLWPHWFDGALWDGDRRITAEDPGVRAAFDWFAAHADKYGVENLRKFGASFGNFSSPQNPFLAGRVAMVLQGVWMHNFIRKYAPQLEWSAAPFPARNPMSGEPVTLVECDVLVIPRGARHPREAFEFLRYLQTQPAMEKLCLAQQKFSPLAAQSPDFAARHANPYINVFIALARSRNTFYVPRITIWNEYRDEMLVAANRVLNGTATPSEALAELQRRVQWKYDRILRRWDLVRDERLREWESYDTW